MGNQMDGRFNQRKNYSVRGRDFTAKISCSGSAWQAVLYFSDNAVSGVSFASEDDALKYCRQKNSGVRLAYVASVDDKPQSKVTDVASAKEAMLREAPRKFDPRIATAPGESVQQFSYTADQIEKVNEGILESYCERHASDFYSVNYNKQVLARCLDDQLQETPGVILNDTLISSTIAQLEAANMLVPRVVKRGDTAVTPYRRLSQVAEAVEQQNLAEQDREALRRRSLPLEEQRALLAADNPDFQGQGSTIHRSASQVTQTTSRVNAGRQISQEEAELRRQLRSGEVSFDDLKAAEMQRRARSKR